MNPSAATPGAYRPRLQRRLMRAFVGFTLLVVGLLGALALAFVYAVEDEFFEATLQAEVDRQRRHAAAHGGFTEPATPGIRLHPKGRGLPAELVEPVARHPQRTEFAGGDGRHYHLRRLDADGTLLVAEVGQQLVVRRMREELLAWILAAAGGLALLALAAGAWLSRRISTPLATLARRIADGAPDALPRDLSRGLEHDEVGQLARHLDALHARTRDFIDREQAFTADASHELRTPLAVLAVALDRLQAQADGDSLPLVRSMQAAAWQLGQTVESMLALAREPAPAAAIPQQALLPELERLVLANAPLLDAAGVDLRLAVPPTVTRPWPPALTHVLIGNLLGNAVAHALHPRVVIEADADEVRVRNPGAAPAAGAQAVASVRERAAGLDGRAGLGRGLSIARRLAARHGLAVTLAHRDGEAIATVRRADPDAAATGRP